MRTNIKLLLTIVLLFIVGCGESFNTEKYYREHTDIRDKKIRECRQLNSMTAAQEKDCQNANQAVRVPYRKSNYKDIQYEN